MEAQRPGFPNLEMNPAPGYDARMPHDLMHLVVEAQLGLAHGIYGQLAAGGDAGSFHLSVTNDEGSRQLTRTRKRVSTRGKKLMSRGRDDCLQSERATYICWQEWLARSSSHRIRGTASAGELHNLNQKKLAEICQHLDQLSARWSSLKVGESMAVGWPDLSVS